MHGFPASLIVLLTIGGGVAVAKQPARPALTLDAINAATFAPLPDPADRKPHPQVVKAEVFLDRARFSPGSIDGIDGDNFRKALAAYQKQGGLPVSGRLDQATWDKLASVDTGPVLVKRLLTKPETEGPYVKHIPAKMEDQAKLARMAYHDLAEQLSEEVHASPGLLRALNPRMPVAAGQDIVVPQVVVDRGPPAKVARIMVDKTGLALKALSPDGKLLAFYPASIGSAEKPAPTGQFTVEHVTHNPDYTYNPDYAFKGVKATKPFRIAPGPNNPVGSVWIALSADGYGIHGTPQPDLVGKTQSHGCIRLTNWNVEDLASMVGKGTTVVFEGEPASTPSAKLP